jgi:tetratricopeptide (TPR) repeat protein
MFIQTHASGRRAAGLLSAFVIIAIAAGCQPEAVTAAESGQQASTQASKLGAPLFEGLGSYQRDVTTKNELVRRYFNQGMVFTYGFNHAEAARSFREAARLDPQCAACWWGVALVLGPNINLPMMETDNAEAYAASQKAASLARKASPVERALIQALTKRYAKNPPADRSDLDRAYANAMRQVAQQFPNDADVLTLFAESLMDLSPWNYWLPDGTPRDATREVLQALEKAIELNPEHPGALHYYIHATEQVMPEKAVDAADKLWHLAPAAGHLVHMPSHIYIRVGRYHDAVLANLEAGKADQRYIAQCNVQGFYPLLYHPHNWHFVWAASVFEGNREQALAAAAEADHLMHGYSQDDEMFGPVVQHFALTPLFAAVRFAQWDRIDAMQKPDPKLIYPTAMWHQARGSAFASRGDFEAAERERAEVAKLLANPELEKVQISPNNNARQVVAVAERMLAGDIAARRKDYSAAIAALKEAVRNEDALGYNEPEDWHYPVRQMLGAVLLEAGKPAEAVVVYEEDLKKHPENGWSLFGLEKALRQLGKTQEADAVKKRFEAAWKYADVELKESVVR